MHPTSPLPDTPRPRPEAACLEARGLECIKGERLLFRGLELSLAGGRLLQVEGANGSGKTSLLRILAGLARPTAGQVLWNGLDIDEHRAHYHARMLYLGHLNGIKSELTAEENLRFALRLSRRPSGLSVDEALERVGLYEQAELPARVLSMGQRRRVALARLLLVKAPLWILDEPLNGLDRQGTALVAELLAEHVARGGMAIVSTHLPLALAGQVPVDHLRVDRQGGAG